MRCRASPGPCGAGQARDGVWNPLPTGTKKAPNACLCYHKDQIDKNFDGERDRSSISEETILFSMRRNFREDKNHMNHQPDADSKENRLTCHPVGRPLSGSGSQAPKPSQGPTLSSRITIFYLDAGLPTIKKIKNEVQQVQYVQQVQTCRLGCPTITL